MTITQVSEFGLGDETRDVTTLSFSKRARVASAERDSGSSSNSRCRSYDGLYGPRHAANKALPQGKSSSASPLSPVPEAPRSGSAYRSASAAAAESHGAYGNALDNGGCCYPPPRSGSPTPSYASSSAFSAATTSATSLSSRASLSSGRSSFTIPRRTSLYSSGSGGGGGGQRDRGSRSSRSSSSSSNRPSSSSSLSRSPCPSSSRRAAPFAPATGVGVGGGGIDFFPKPLPLTWRGHSNRGGGDGGANRRRRGFAGDATVGAERRSDSGGVRDRRSRSRGRHGLAPPSRRSSGKDYASEASSAGCGLKGGSRISASGSGRKRNRSCSRERRSSSSSRGSRRRNPEWYSSGVECPRCFERCRSSNRETRKPITRTLPMDYWVRTPRCKAAKSKHIDFIDDVAYSREQFIEETVFTCPFTGVRRDKVLERNMFPYDVPTDVEHWTLWSREDLDDDQMEAFVREWAAENHPHVVEWECDNNEGERSIDWFHVHVFFRVGCEDRTGVPRDPASVYDGPVGSCSNSSKREEEDDDDSEEEEEEGAAVGVGTGRSGGVGVGDVGLGAEAAGGDRGGSDAWVVGLGAEAEGGDKGGSDAWVSPCASADIVSG